MAPHRRPNRAVLAGVILAGVAVLIGLGWAFQPWQLLVNTTVEDQLPPAAVGTEAGRPGTPAPLPSSTGPRPTTDLRPSSTPRAEAPTSSSAPAPTARVLRQGRLISHEHQTSGTATIIEQPGGQRLLRLSDLDTSSGPDLRVWLSAGPVVPDRAGWFVFADHPYVELGRLKGNRGNQNYAIPAAADLEDLTSAVIWCRRFRVSFGAADLAG